MIGIILALIFFWLIYRELNSRTPYKPYLVILIILAIASAWVPVRNWFFEKKLTAVAQQLAEGHPASVHCNTLFDTLFDEELNVRGHAHPETGDIVIQYPHCNTLMDYISHPRTANQDELISLNILTHESMHARGEYNEAKTECQAVQRNYRTAILLGIPHDIAKQNARDYYEQYYLKRNDGYFSKECALDKSLDEHLNDSPWNLL